MKKILFASYEVSDFSTIERVLPLLQKAGIEPVLLDSHPPLPRSKKEKWETISLPLQQCDAPVKRFRPEVINFLNKFFGDDQVSDSLKDWIIRRPAFVESAIAKLKPDLVVMSPGWVEHTYVRDACRKLSVKYCYLVPPYYEFKSTAFVDIEPVFYLVAGEEGRKRFIVKGAKPEDVMALGNPAFDSLFQFKKRFKKSVSINWIKPFKFKTILLTLQNKEDDKVLSGLLLRYVASRKGVRLAIRPHPLKPAETWVREAAKAKFVELRSTNKTLNQEIKNADVLVTCSSGAILNALVLNLPVITFKNDYFPDETPFAASGDSMNARDYGELQKALDQILFDKNFRDNWRREHRESYQKYLSSENGDAAEKVTEGLLEMVSS